MPVIYAIYGSFCLGMYVDCYINNKRFWLQSRLARKDVLRHENTLHTLTHKMGTVEVCFVWQCYVLCKDKHFNSSERQKTSITILLSLLAYRYRYIYIEVYILYNSTIKHAFCFCFNRDQAHFRN